MIVRAANLHKDYRMGDSVVHALAGVDLAIGRGDIISVTGASGSGKSTLMHILGCLDRPSSGTLEFRNEMVSGMSEKQLARTRNRHIGFVFQTFNLINRTTALENVLVPLIYTRERFSKKRAHEALERVGLIKRAKHHPCEMSGGECQRVAIARAIVNNPDLILADEPTGNLDTQTGEQIMKIFHELHADGITVILVTHEMDIAAQADRMIHMKDGHLVEDVMIDNARRDQMLSHTQDSQARMFREKAAAKGHVPQPKLDPTTGVMR